MNVNITTKKAQFLNQEAELTERTVIETITIKDVHSFSDMEDAFEQIAGFAGNLFQDEFEEGEAKERLINDALDAILNQLKPKLEDFSSTLKSYPCDVKIPHEYFPEPDPHDFLANAKQAKNKWKGAGDQVSDAVRKYLSYGKNSGRFDEFDRSVKDMSAQAERFMDGLKEDEYRKIDSCFKAANEIFNTAKEIISAIKEVKNQSAPKPNFASGGFVSGVDASKTGEIIPPRTASDKPEYAYKKSNCGYLYVKFLSDSSLAVEVLDVIAGVIRSYSKPTKYYMPDGFSISVNEYMDKFNELKTSGKKKKR
jgi:hypothetical protein